MNGLKGNHLVGDNVYELRLVTKWVVFLAILTGILYLRAALVEGRAAIRSDQLPIAAILLFVFLTIGTLGLFIAWRRQALGGLLALSSGIGLATIDYGILDRDGWIAALLYSSPFLVASVLCLACWWRDRPELDSA